MESLMRTCWFRGERAKLHHNPEMGTTNLRVDTESSTESHWQQRGKMTKNDNSARQENNGRSLGLEMGGYFKG